MKGRRKTGAVLCSILSLIMLLTAGCSSVKVPDTLSESALSIAGNGEVTVYLVEAFDKAYYDLAELEQMVRAELAEFNGSRKTDQGDVVRLVSLAMLADGSQKVGLKLWFQNADIYQSYTGRTLFYGTVAQAHAAGCDLAVELTSVKDGSRIGEMEIYENGTRKLLIAQERVRIYGPGKPVYVNTEATVNEDGSVELTTDTEENIYIIMK